LTRWLAGPSRQGPVTETRRRSAPPSVGGDRPVGLEALRQDLQFQAQLRGAPMGFATTWGLFSPKEVDAGTRLLLEHVEVAAGERLIDLGCGYGALGLPLAREAAPGQALLLDKDFVAVEYARRNAIANGLTQVEARLSNLFSAVPERGFDLIVSNVPAKSGKELYQLMVLDAWERLRPGGRCYLVFISHLRPFFQRMLATGFTRVDKLKQGADYSVLLAERAP